MERGELARLLAVLAAAYRQEITKTQAIAYEMGLEDVDPAALAGAVKRAVREEQFLPSVARLRELAGAGKQIPYHRPPAGGDMEAGIRETAARLLEGTAPPPPGDMVAMAAMNARQAETHLEEARRRLSQWPEPGEERREALYLCRRYRAEVAHWRGYEAFYRTGATNPQSAPARPARAQPARVAVAPEPDRRLPREEDDDELPF